MRRLAVLFAGVALVAGLVACGGDETGDAAKLEVLEAEGSVDYDFVIPPGTQDKIRAGELVEIVPQRLDVEVGESIRIRNDDDRGAFVGIFYVGAGEVVRMRFTTPGELKGACDVHPSGEFIIDVAEAA